MKKLIVYEMAEDLGSSILGLNVDPDRKRFDEMIPTLESYDVEVIRYNHIDHENKIEEDIKLPSLELDGKFVTKGRYPQRFEVANWFEIPVEAFAAIPKQSLFEEANSAFGGACCGLNDDLYLDPNEE